MYRESTKGLLKHLDFILWDLLCVFVAFLLAFYTRHLTLQMDGTYRISLLTLLLIDFMIIVMTDAFHRVIRRGYLVELSKTLEQGFFLFLVHTAFLFLTGRDRYSRIASILTAIYYVIFCYLIRCLWKKYLRSTNENSGKNSLLIMVTSRRLREALNMIKERNFGSYNIAGLILLDSNGEVPETIRDIPVRERTENIRDIIGLEWVDEVLLLGDADVSLTSDEIDDIVTMGVTVHQALDLKNASLSRSRSFQTVLGYQSVSTSLNVMGIRQAVFKRTLDIIGGLVGCLFTLLITIFVGPVIYIKSPGPIFFSQIRIGKNGRRFKIYKFRSMYMDAEERKAALMAQNELGSDLMFKMKDDPRIIGGQKGIGGFIRRTSLDEFPQFFNVLKGDMSLVGTRPPTVDEWNQYEYHHRARMGTRPGITGMWQVSGRSDITDFEEVVRLDTYYIENWSIALDFKIIFKTIAQLFKNKGAM